MFEPTMILFSELIEMMDRKESGIIEKKDAPKPDFEKIYMEKLNRRRSEFKRSEEARAEATENQQLPDYSMQKLFLSMLLRLGGPAPDISSGDPAASTVLLHSLQAWRYGARTPFSQDTDIFSMPQYPIVRTKTSEIS